MGKKEKKKSKGRSRSRSRDRSRDRSQQKKSKKRYSSPTDSSDSSPDRKRKKKSKHHTKERRALTAEEIQLLKDEKKKQKELAKALETPEEKRARRLSKKEAKERGRKEKMGWDEEYMGYTNMDNPFGDEHLLDTFVWKQKLDKEGKAQLTMPDIEKMQKNKMIENKLELEKVKKRRLEREREREEKETEREMLQREKEADYYNAWEKQEDKFHLQQAKLRSKIRIDDGRAKPIDLLAKYVSAEDDDLAVEMHEPYSYLNGLMISDLEDLLEDIKVYLELEAGKNMAYWRDIITITEDELTKLRKIDPNSVGERRTGINQSVADDVASIFKGKTLSQLNMLETSIHNKLKGGQGIDVGYWESLLQQLKAHIARTRLRERHQESLRRKLFKLKQEQGITESAPLFPILPNNPSATSTSATSSPRPAAGTSSPAPPAASASSSAPAQEEEEIDEKPVIKQEEGEEAEAEAGTSGEQPGTSRDDNDEEDEEEEGLEFEEEEEEGEDPCFVDYTTCGYSPKLLRVSELEPDTIVYEEGVDDARLDFARKSVLKTGKAKKDNDAELVKRARDGMTGEEAQFSVEVPLETQALIWSDKYRPRKPRFFNRVHTGFEWNKYNQTHYDIDNPPPKIVQGYKFNIFYPDLIDKSNTPAYTLTPLQDEQDFATLKFSAGPPYEDIAFKIVNREWEYSYKKGFRCQFHNNIFQLWFHFKRYRYRR